MFNFVYRKIDFSHKLGTAAFKDDQYEEHIHYFFEIVFFVSGEATYTVQTETKKLTPGNIILIQPGKVHYANVINEETYERYVLKFPLNVIPSFLSEKLIKIDSFPKKTKKYSYIFEKMDEYFKKYKGEELFTLFICELVRLCIFICNDEVEKEESKSNEFINELIEYIDDHICEKISISSLSDHFYYSPSYIDYEFKKIMRMSITKYIRNKRIYLANELMNAGVKAHEAAERVGFSDYSTFYRCFIKVMGFQPSKHN